MDRQRRVLLVSVALLAGAATSLAFAPADWIPLAVLGPALGLWAAVEARTGVLGAVCGLAYGIAWSFSTLHWMFELDPLAAVALAFIQSVFWAPTGAVAAVGAQRLGPAWWVAVTSATWTVSEAARARIPLTGFEWGQLSMATVGLPLRRAASVVGALGMTGLVVALAAVLVVLTWRRDGHVARVVAGLLVVIAAMVGLGTVTWTAGGRRDPGGRSLPG
jgi:apolipoprotein N-acyltransferase